MLPFFGGMVSNVARCSALLIFLAGWFSPAGMAASVPLSFSASFGATDIQTRFIPVPRGTITIIIDDIGYRHTDAMALSLPPEVTFSVLPDTPLANELALSGHAQGRDIMLHLPMEAHSDRPLGPAALTSAMYPEAISKTTRQALQSLPFAIGVNNHMGSRLTEQWQPMQALMRTLKAHDKFFIDSRTTIGSVAEQAAVQAGVPVARRHVFLDNQLSESYMQSQLSQLIRLAKQRGSAIGIAHPHPQTIRFLNKALSTVRQHGVILKPVSQLMHQPVIPEPEYARQVASAPATAPR